MAQWETTRYLGPLVVPMDKYIPPGSFLGELVSDGGLHGQRPPACHSPCTSIFLLEAHGGKHLPSGKLIPLGDPSRQTPTHLEAQIGKGRPGGRDLMSSEKRRHKLDN